MSDSQLKPTAVPFTPKSWADEDEDEQEDGTLREEFGMASPGKAPTSTSAQSPSKPQPRPSGSGDKPTNTDSSADAPVASLLSRISGLSTSSPSDPPLPPSNPSSTTSTSLDAAPLHQIPTTRPKPQTSNNLFGKALAGVKTDRTSSAATPATATTGESASSSAAPEPAASTSAPANGFGETSSSGTQPAKDTAQGQSDKADQGKMTHNLMDSQDDSWGTPSGNGNASSANANDNGNGHNAGRELLDERMSEGTGLISNEFQVEVKLADLQADPNSPLYSVKTFEELPLHPDLLKGIYAAGFKKPSKIQEKALPLLLHNPPRNLIGQSQSGTGKTAAFTLNMLSRVETGMLAPQAICLAPSRELARQIFEVVEKIGQFTSINACLAVPGSWKRNESIKQQIIIGTPGTLVDMLSRGTRIFDPKHIRVFVLDEADEMIALQGLGDQTTRIKRMLPAGVQNLLFSATFPDEVQAFADLIAPEANKIFLKKEDVTVDAIKQLWLECDGEDQKYEALSALYDVMSIGQSMVFCKRKDTADKISERLKSEGHSVASLHGDKMTDERDAILDGFRDGKTKVLITTNVIARGIDIQQVNMVVNYDVPDMGREGGFGPDIETYIHRIGRTGRFGRKGCSVIFVHDDRSRRDVETIASTLGKPMKKIDATSRTDLDQLEKALKAAMKGTN